ncbi:MFS transporter [Rickettsiella endosymbiont of Miltochrista miniata]|uniref:MFS transporter n=1 Tax=Rickettsiella endosymbiont of Miltochrista miniata TaxID=3066239 RepID=UPI00313D359C
MPKKRIDLFPWLVCGLGALFYCYEYFLRILPSVMTEDLLKMFNISGLAFGNLVAFYYYAYTPMQLPVGMMMDRFGPRKLLAFACLICAVGTYLFAHHYLSTAQVGRFLVGFGSAFAFVGMLKLAAIWFPPSRFAFIAGMATSLGMIGAMTGDIVLSKLVFTLGSTVTLYISAVIGLLLTVCLWYVIPEAKSVKTTQEGGGTLTLSYGEFFQAVFKLCRNPQMWLVGVIGSLLYLSLSAFAEVWGIPYLIRTYGLSNSTAAVNISFIFLGWAIGSPLVGWISDKIGNRRHPIIIGALLGAFLFTLLIYFPFFSSHYLAIILFSFGLCSSAQIIVFPIARELNVQGLAGTAIAVTNLLVMLGGALSEPLIGKALDVVTGTHVRGNLMAFSVESFQHALTIIPVAFVIAAVLAVFVKETRGVVADVPIDGAANRPLSQTS